MRRLGLGHPTRWLAAHSEGELPQARRRRVEAHLERCARCRERLRDIRRGLAAAQDLGPVPLPAEERQRIERSLAHALASGALRPAPRRGRTRALRWAVAGATAAALAAALWIGGRRGVELEAAPGPPGRLEALALAAHRELAAGTPLELATDSPAEVRAWLAARGLSAALADARPPGEATRYRLAGATDLSRPGLAAAAVLYEVDGEPLVLVAGRQAENPDAPRWSPLGKRVRHRESDEARVLTWTNSGKAYALVSGPRRVERGCLLCHTDERRRALVDGLALPGT